MIHFYNLHPQSKILVRLYFIILADILSTKLWFSHHLEQSVIMGKSKFYLKCGWKWYKVQPNRICTFFFKRQKSLLLNIQSIVISKPIIWHTSGLHTYFMAMPYWNKTYLFGDKFILFIIFLYVKLFFSEIYGNFCKKCTT